MIKNENGWNNFQEPQFCACIPNSYMRLLSAMDQGWKVIKVELAPSWDQYGFIYLVTLKHQSRKHSQQMVLPKNCTFANLIHSFALPTDIGQARQTEYA
jgi:hypothetical protein